MVGATDPTVVTEGEVAESEVEVKVEVEDDAPGTGAEEDCCCVPPAVVDDTVGRPDTKDVAAEVLLATLGEGEDDEGGDAVDEEEPGGEVVAALVDESLGAPVVALAEGPREGPTVWVEGVTSVEAP